MDYHNEGPAEAEISELRQHDRNGGYPGTAGHREAHGGDEGIACG